MILPVEEGHRLTFSPVRGFMKGYIDMIFEYEGRYYLVDYKSNMLGSKTNDYEYSTTALAVGCVGCWLLPVGLIISVLLH
ncbi:hypothetical protein BGS_0823 [Beggiatoa sp. SS]|nr:hypothetical protein BGS_0823 [Beggiatoa sp. SS]